MLTQGALTRSGDPLIYHQIALNLVSGEGLVWRPGGSWGDLRALFPPLYPLLLSGAETITGGSPLAAFLLNSLLDGATAWAIILIAKQFRAVRAGAAAAYLYLIWPSILLAAPFPQKESLAVLLVLAQIAALAFIWRTREVALKSCALFGVFTGLLALTQPAWTLLAALLVFFSLPVTKLAGAVRLAGLSLPFFAVVFLPWWIRNWIVLGEFVPLTTAGGFTFYFETLQGWKAPAAAFHLPEAERMSFLSGVAAEWVMSHPAEYLLNKIKAAALALGLEHSGVERLRDLSSPPAVRAESFSVASQFSLIILWALAFLAAVFARSTLLSNRFFASMLIAFFLQLFLSNFWIQFAERHRAPLGPIILLWAMMVFSERIAERKNSGAGRPHPARTFG